jgi:predicted TIM-barrel fold metal-dependent hydrolase
MISAFDIHCHLGQDEIYGFSQTAGELLKKMAKANIQKAVVFPFASVENREENNRHIIRAVAKYPEQFVGFHCVNPRAPKTLDEIRTAEKRGLRGVLVDLAAFTNSLGEPCVYRVFEACAGHQLPILLHVYPALYDIAPGLGALATRFPDLPIITQFSGIPSISLVFDEHSNIFLETSYMYDPTPMYGIVKSGNANRIMFGSNSPQGDPYVERKRIDISEEGTPINARTLMSNHYKELILRRNMARLLSLE